MMTPETLAPSADVAKATTATAMRFFYPLAAICLAAVLFTPQAGEAQTAPIKLRPDQQRAIEIALQDVEPAMRPMAREQLAKSFANFSEAQIAMMMAKMDENKKAAAAKPVKVVEEPKREATPADLAFNKAQYEPVIRKHWTAQKKFDELTAAKFESYCPKRDEFARFGSAWRYEQGGFSEATSLATWNVETDVQVAGEAYAPHDGRYMFDFSKVRMTYDEKAIDAIIKQACDQVRLKGKDFLAKLDPMVAREDWDGAFKLERAAQAALSPIRAEVQSKFKQMSPGDFTEIQLAMMNGTKVK